MVDWVMVLGILAGAGVLVAGLWLMRGARRDSRSAARDDDRTPDASISMPTRMALGICLMVGGYHIAAYSSPADWFPLKVPVERWWVLVGGSLAAVGLARLGDVMERNNP